MRDQIIKSPAQMDKMIKVTSPGIWVAMGLIALVVIAAFAVIFTQSVELKDSYAVVYFTEEKGDVPQTEEEFKNKYGNNIHDTLSDLEANYSKDELGKAVYLLPDEDFVEYGSPYECKAYLMDDTGKTIGVGWVDIVDPDAVT